MTNHLSRIFFSLFIPLLLITDLHADTIELKSGQIIEGEILSQTDDSVKIKTELGIEITYFAEEISSVNGGQFKEDTASTTLNYSVHENSYDQENTARQQKNVSDLTNTLIKKREKVEEVIDQIGGGLPEQFETIKEEMTEKFTENFDTQKERIMDKVEKLEYENRLQSFLKIYPLNFWKIIFFCWLLSCFPLMRVANLLQADNPWLAWVPGFHFLLLINIAERSRIWFMLILAPVFLLTASFFLQIEAAPKIFLIGIIFSFVSIYLIPITLWLSIVERLQRQKIIALFMSIPVLNVILIYYLAFNFKSFKDNSKSRSPQKKQKQIPGRF